MFVLKKILLDNRGNQFIEGRLYLAYIYGVYGAVMLIYLSTYIMLRVKYHWLSTTATQQNEDLQKKERRLLYQGFIVMVPFMLDLAVNHIMLTYEDLADKLSLFEQVLFLIGAANNPFVYLWFNRELRDDVRTMLVIRIVFVQPTPTAVQAGSNQNRKVPVIVKVQSIT